MVHENGHLVWRSFGDGGLREVLNVYVTAGVRLLSWLRRPLRILVAQSEAGQQDTNDRYGTPRDSHSLSLEDERIDSS